MMIITAVNVDDYLDIISPLRFYFALCENIIRSIHLRRFIYVVLAYLESTWFSLFVQRKTY